MSPRTRVLVFACAAALLAAGGTVALAVLTANDEPGEAQAEKPLDGAPPVALDLGVRVDPEARALRKAEGLIDKGKRPEAARIFERYDSPEARIGAAFVDWPGSGLAELEQLASDHGRSAVVLLHLGYAELWAGHSDKAAEAWRRAAAAEPDTWSAQRANDALHPGYPSGQPLFVPSFAPPASLTSLTPPEQLAALERASRGSDTHAKLLYGLALQRLGRRISAGREYDAAAKAAPNDAEAQVAAAVVRFDKSRPAAAFSRLGPLTRRFPEAATVRFHLGLMLLWLARENPGSVDEAKRQLRLARKEEPDSSLAREADKLLHSLRGVSSG